MSGRFAMPIRRGARGARTGVVDSEDIGVLWFDEPRCAFAFSAFCNYPVRAGLVSTPLGKTTEESAPSRRSQRSAGWWW